MLDKRDFPGATFPEWLHKFEARKPFDGEGGYGPGHNIRVTAGAHYLKGNRLPYFSVTGEIWKDGRTRDCEACGCIHDDILRHWPELASVVALHLSDYTGEPSYAEANGWYWLAGYYGPLVGDKYTGGTGPYGKPPEECLRIFAEYVRISVDTARELARVWALGVEYAEAKPMFIQWCLEQRSRWESEAKVAIAQLDSLREGVR